MLKTFNLAKYFSIKYAAHNLAPAIEAKLIDVKNTFPEAAITSEFAAIDYIKNIANRIIHKLIRCNSLKQCSELAPLFAAVASKDGLATVIAYTPGHQYNIILTENGLLGVDFTALQFKVDKIAQSMESELMRGQEDDSEYDWVLYNNAAKYLLEKAFRNPFESIRVWPIKNLAVLNNTRIAAANDLFGAPVAIHYDEKYIQKEYPDYANESDSSIMHEPHPLRGSRSMGFE